MNILITGDLHLTDKTPENRIDDYPLTVLEKFTFILNTASDKKVDYIIQPGDFFDHPNPSYSLFSKVVTKINGCGIPIITVFGQHDLRYRNHSNTALLALSKACPLVRLRYTGSLGDNIYVQEAGYESPIPLPKPTRFNVLVTHRMIVDKKLWEDQEDFSYASDFLKQHKYDLIVSGDNHQFFVENIKDRWLINCGSMMRSSIVQVEHFPAVMLFEIPTTNWAEINIPIKPIEEVFKMEQVVKTKERDEKLDAFVEGLSAHKEMGLSFEDNLNTYMKANKVDQSVRDIIRGGME